MSIMRKSVMASGKKREPHAERGCVLAELPSDWVDRAASRS